MRTFLLKWRCRICYIPMFCTYFRLTTESITFSCSGLNAERSFRLLLSAHVPNFTLNWSLYWTTPMACPYDCIPSVYLSLWFALSGLSSFRESPRPNGQDPNLWTVGDVMQYIRDIDPVLAPHADLFRKHVRVLSLIIRNTPQISDILMYLD